jgi:hypothetical protein
MKTQVHLAVAGVQILVRGDKREITATELVDTILLYMEQARTP